MLKSSFGFIVALGALVGTAPDCAASCDLLFGETFLRQAPRLEVIRIYTPLSPLAGRTILRGFATDIFGELHRLRDRSPAAFELFRSIVGREERNYESIWSELAALGADDDAVELIRATKLVGADDRPFDAVIDVLAAATAVIRYPTREEIFSGSGRAFEVLGTSELGDDLRYATEVAAEHLFDPLGLGDRIVKPTSFNFTPMGYARTLGL